MHNTTVAGAVIFTGNHMNQFVDGAIVVTTNPHRVGFLVAEKSWKKAIIGHFAKATGSIPVTRPQDSAVKGRGKVLIDGLKLMGTDTHFKSFGPGDKIRPGRSSEAYRLKRVISDTEAELTNSDADVSPLKEPQMTWMTYDIFEFVDQSDMFTEVHSALARGKCLGIFPEGGSHDNTDLLPLKVGTASIAYGLLEKRGVNVPIVPVGITYFQGHRFRSRVVVEFGEPIRISKEMAKQYKDSKRDAYHSLLSNVADGMRSVIVTAADYDQLKIIHTVRRLYQRPSTVTTKEKQDLSRRFSIGVRILLNAGLPKDLQTLSKRIREYQTDLDYLGLRDYQVSHLGMPYTKLFFTFLHALVLFFIASIPAVMLNAPVGLIANLWAAKEAKVALAGSRVKLRAKDVIMSQKIIVSLVAVPSLWILYALLMSFFTNLSTKEILVALFSLPVFSYAGVMAVEAGMADLKDMRPAFLRLLPSFRQKAEEIHRNRSELQIEVRAAVKKYGPTLGGLYTDVEVQWDQWIKKVAPVSEDGALKESNSKVGNIDGTISDEEDVEERVDVSQEETSEKYEFGFSLPVDSH